MSRGWKSAREKEREREKSRVKVRERMRRAWPSRDDVNTARNIRLGPSWDVGIRYRDARLRREVSKRHQI
jgi:hypothetical protein